MSKVRGPSAPFPLNYMYTLDTYLRMWVATYTHNYLYKLPYFINEEIRRLHPNNYW